MGFLDKAKAAATELAAKADTALASSGLGGPGVGVPHPDRLLRDLGVIAYLEGTGRAAPAGERERVLHQLRDAEQRGTLGALTLQTNLPAPGTVPPPPGAAAQAAQAAPAGQAPPPPPGPPPAPPVPPGGGAPLTVDGPDTPPAPPVTPPPPPPPPSWASGDR